LKNKYFYLSILLIFSAASIASNPSSKARAVLDKERPRKAMDIAKHFLTEGIHLYNQGRFKESLEELKASLLIQEELGMGLSEETAKTHLAIVSSYIKLTDSCKAKRHFQSAAKIYNFMDRKITPSAEYRILWESCPSSVVELSNL
jgi:tetratricopeptide (TPR) repeat protein